MGCADQAEVALIDEVAEADALVLIFLGDGDDESEVRSDQFVERLLLALPDALGERVLLLSGEERVCADFLEVLVERTVFVTSLVGRREAAHAALRGCDGVAEFSTTSATDVYERVP